MREEIIGDCRLILGDCADILPTLRGIGSVLTDPPYGMAFKSNYRKVFHQAIANDKSNKMLHLAISIDASHSKYIFCRWDNIYDLPKPKSLITWVKNNWSMGDLIHEHARQTELALFYPGQQHFFPKYRPSDVIEVPRTGNGYHPTEKPVELMERFVEWTSGLVLDPFMGSGTTGVACAKQRRQFIGCEIDERYFNIACRRIEEAYKQLNLFIQPTEKPTQLTLIAQEAI